MATYLVKQPNGRYATFSTIVDDFTAMNLTHSQAGTETSWEAVDAADGDLPHGSEFSSGEHRRWREVLAAVRSVHGPVTERVRDKVGRSDPARPLLKVYEVKTKVVGYAVRIGNQRTANIASVAHPRIAREPAVALARKISHELTETLRDVGVKDVCVVRLVRIA